MHFVVGGKLRSGEVISCGCAKAAICAAANTTHGASARGRMTAEYRAWQNIIYRCENRNARQWADWGGRGIKMWAGWRHDFGRFLAALGPRPSEHHTIERINNDKNYVPGNVRWATRREQNRNKRNVRMMTFKGTRLPRVEWAEKVGLQPDTLAARITAGWSVRRALTTPTRQRLRVCKKKVLAASDQK